MGVMVDSARGTGMSVHGCHDIGPDYAVTLRAWRDAWEERKEEVLALGYNERFWRKYRFYFAYCEAAFDAKYIHTYQVTWVKDEQPTLTAEDMQRSSKCPARSEEEEERGKEQDRKHSASCTPTNNMPACFRPI